MFAPDLRRLALAPRTGVPPPPHSAARDDVLSEGALVATILASIRNGDADAACRMAVNWCRRVSQFNRSACEGNPQLWKMLAERVFPNWRQAVFPPAWNYPGVAHALRKRELHGMYAYEVPWSGVSEAMSWKDWFFYLCRQYKELLRERQQRVARARAHRKHVRREAREAYRALKRATEWSSQWAQAVDKHGKLEGERRAAGRRLVRERRALADFQGRFGHTEDGFKKLLDSSREFFRAPDHDPTALDPEPSIASSSDEDESDALTDQERMVDARSGETFDDSENDEPDEQFFARMGWPGVARLNRVAPLPLQPTDDAEDDEDDVNPALFGDDDD